MLAGQRRGAARAPDEGAHRSSSGRCSARARPSTLSPARRWPPAACPRAQPSRPAALSALRGPRFLRRGTRRAGAGGSRKLEGNGRALRASVDHSRTSSCTQGCSRGKVLSRQFAGYTRSVPPNLSTRRSLHGVPVDLAGDGHSLVKRGARAPGRQTRSRSAWSAQNKHQGRGRGFRLQSLTSSKASAGQSAETVCTNCSQNESL